uniref:DH domain-containing protein n=1 Tax=Trichogramma kaykai TaxID=54128 RepID=A0ABD2VXH2_9HYME
MRFERARSSRSFFCFHLQLSAVSPSPISSIVGPVTLKFRVARARILLAGSRAEVDLDADVKLLHGEVLLIEDCARLYSPLGDTDRRHRWTEKLLYAEEEYWERLSSAKDQYAKAMTRKYSEFKDILFKPLADLAKVIFDFCQRIQEWLENWPGESFKPSDLFPASLWSAYWAYLERYAEARRTLDRLEAEDSPLLRFLEQRQAAAKYSPSALLLLPVSSLYFYRNT